MYPKVDQSSSPIRKRYDNHFKMRIVDKFAKTNKSVEKFSEKYGISPSMIYDWKSAIISPLYKGKGNIDECDNYRGISILQPIIKVFERVLAAQVVSYFEKNGLFCSVQLGFRSNHSCETALQCILDDWKTFLFKREIVFSLFIDF